MRLSVTHRLRRARIFFKTTAVTVIVAFLGLYLQPSAIAAQLPKHKGDNAVTKQATDEEKLVNALENIEKKLERLETKLAKAQDASLEKSDLKKLHKQLIALDRKAMKNFNRIEQHLTNKKLPQVILDRHHQAVAAYKAELKTLRDNLKDVEAATTDDQRRAKAYKARERLKKKRKRRRHQPFDPNRLPLKSPRPNPDNKPKKSKEAFRQAGLFNHPHVKVVTHGTFNFDQLAGADDPAFLAETIEVTLSASIEAKAAELEHNPVKIYNWVRNNIEWLPSWGAIQSAEHTLGSRRGNAFDISSLLIALLRASGIPARYVHGTIDVPAEQFRHWVGSFEDTEAAQDYASAGGIPIISVTSGGQIIGTRLEHVWVEAAIDFFPSRGAINRSADNWLQLDPSFKLNQRFDVPDVVGISGVQADVVIQDFVNSGTVNEQEGSVQGLDGDIITQAYTLSSDIRDEIGLVEQQFLAQTYDADDQLDLAQLMGGEKSPQLQASVLPSTLPYRTVVVGARYDQIPQSLRGVVTFAFQVDIFGDPVDGISLPLAQINNRKLSLAFTFATEEDHDAFAAFLPDAEITDISQLPTSIPAYLVNVVPELRLDDEVIKTGASLKLGEELRFIYAPHLPGQPDPRPFIAPVTAGSHLGVGVAAGSINAELYDTVSQRYEEATDLLDSGTVDDILAFAPDFRNRLTSDVHYVGLLEYFDKQMSIGDLIAKGAGAGRIQLLCGIGTFGYVPNSRFFFGVPRTIETGSIQVDAQHLLFNARAYDNNAPTRKLLATQIGVVGSLLEADVPAGLFSPDESTPADGHSAVSNIQRALEEGQKIFLLNGQNKNVLNQINLSDDVIAEIEAAVDAGFEVVTHTDPLSVSATLTTAGYIILDPITGEGLYKIDNGTNGSVNKEAANEMMLNCAAVNKPGFINPDADWARRKIARKCAEVARNLNDKATETQGKTMKAKFKAIQNFHDVYAKVPLVIADCLVTGFPVALAEALVLIRTAAAQLAIATAQLRVPYIAKWVDKLSEELKRFVDEVGDLCIELST